MPSTQLHCLRKGQTDTFRRASGEMGFLVIKLTSCSFPWTFRQTIWRFLTSATGHATGHYHRASCEGFENVEAAWQAIENTFFLKLDKGSFTAREQ